MNIKDKILHIILFIISLFLISCSEDTPTQIDNLGHGILQGNVYDNMNLAPVMDATVKADTFTTTTDIYGYYKIENIPAGSQSITATKSGYEINHQTIEIQANQTQSLNINLSLTQIIPDSSYWYIFDLSGLKNEADWISCITFDNDSNLWAGLNNGLLKFDGEIWYVYPSLENNLGNIWDMISDDKNNLWIGSRDYGLRKFNGIDWTFYSMKDSLPQVSENAAFGMDFDSRGNLWIGTNEGLVKFNINANEWSIINSYNTNLDWNKERIRSVYVENDLRIWIGCAQWGAAVFNGSYRWDNLNTQPTGYISYSSITQELDGDIWFGHDTHKLDPSGQWTPFNNMSTGYHINAIAIDNANNKWFATHNLYKYDDNILTPIAYPSQISNSNGGPIIIDKNNNKWFRAGKSLIAVYNENYINL